MQHSFTHEAEETTEVEIAVEGLFCPNFFQAAQHPNQYRVCNYICTT